MNKIKIVNDEIKIINLNNSIEYEIKDKIKGYVFDSKNPGSVFLRAKEQGDFFTTLS